MQMLNQRLHWPCTNFAPQDFTLRLNLLVQVELSSKCNNRPCDTEVLNISRGQNAGKKHGQAGREIENINYELLVAPLHCDYVSREKNCFRHRKT